MRHTRLFITLLTLSAWFLLVRAGAQVNVSFDTDNFSEEQKKELKEAIKNIKDGDDFFYNEIPQYRQALDLYLKANAFNPSNSLLNYKIGVCYLKTIQKTKSVPYFEKALALDPKVKPDILFLLGQAYHLNLELDNAIEKFEEYRHILSPDELKENRAKIDKQIEECKVAKEMVEHPVRVFIDNIGAPVNTTYYEYGPYVNDDETVLMFTSCRPNTTGGGVDPIDLIYYEDIYISYKDKSTDKWSEPINPGRPLNTDSHDAIVGISNDGKHALVYKGSENQGDIYECFIKDGSWQNPKPLPKEINTQYHETSASYSPDMQAIYFVSDKPGGYGGKDIYVSRMERKGTSDKFEYGEAVNLGPVINTLYDEEGVFMHPDGKTLYFSSCDHKTMGGYDIFKSVYENGQWSTPENLGYPVNSPDDDVFFSISKDGRHGYFSSYDDKGMGQRDLFMITFLGPEKPLLYQYDSVPLAWQALPAITLALAPKVEIKNIEMVIVKGIIRDTVTLEPLGGVPIEIFDNSMNRVVGSFESTMGTGQYMVTLNSGRNYGFAVRAKDYLICSENVDIPASTTVREITKDFYLKKVEVGAKIILKNIFFDFDKATLRPESQAELDRLVKLLQDMPTLKIEISGHTDNIGSALYNQKLSQNRAKTVVDYLITHGIDETRLSYKGYGFSQPIASNDTDEGRQQNRRTEFKVLSK